MKVFIIRNQNNLYLDKSQGWVSGKDINCVYRTGFHDEALNSLIEVNAKDISLRGEILEVELSEKKQPLLKVSEDAVKLKNINEIKESAN